MSDSPTPAPGSSSIMNRFVASSLSQPLLVILFTLILLGAGLAGLGMLALFVNSKRSIAVTD